MLQIIRRMLGRPPPNTLPPFNFARNRYQAKKQWPPNLSALTERQQFRFERKWKRRTKLKAIRPTWDKWVKITQWTLISLFSVWFVFFEDMRDDPRNPYPGRNPFEGLRAKAKELVGGIWTHTSTNSSQPAQLPHARELESGLGAGRGGVKGDRGLEGGPGSAQ